MKSKMSLLIIIIFILSSIVIYMNSRVIYVSNAGNDNYQGTVNKPLKTINKAIDKALPGTTIRIKSGMYNEAIHIHKSKGEL